MWIQPGYKDIRPTDFPGLGVDQKIGTFDQRFFSDQVNEPYHQNAKIPPEILMKINYVHGPTGPYLIVTGKQ